MSPRRLVPELKQEWEFRARDFARYPVWRNVHGVDQLEPWYEKKNCNEATFRPWTNELPANFTEARLLLVAATMVLKSGKEYPGMCYARRINAPKNLHREDLNRRRSARIMDLQPRLFINDNAIAFWGGLIPIPDNIRSQFYRDVDQPNNIFPIQFQVNQGLTEFEYGGNIKGFYHLTGNVGGVGGLGKQRIGGKAYADNVLQSRRRNAMPALTEELNRIDNLYFDDQLEQALEAVNVLIAEHPDDDRCWSRRSDIYFSLRNIEASLSDLLMAIRCNSLDRSMYFKLANIYLRSGHYEECLRWSESGLAMKSSSWQFEGMQTDDLTFLLARALFGLDRFKEALQKLEMIDYPAFELPNRGDTLLTKRGLKKACTAALRDLRLKKPAKPPRNLE